jgi:hypothetical protein
MCKLFRADLVHEGTYIIRFIDPRNLQVKDRSSKTAEVQVDFERKVKGILLSNNGTY